MVWYVAAGYRLPAGIEAYLLHYATEMRRHGFRTEILVFQPLPRVPHRYLQALQERGIRIRSLYDQCRWQVWGRVAATTLPWLVRALIRTRRLPRVGDWVVWQYKRCAVRRLARLIRREQPDIIHVKGRLIAEAWPVLPTGRTVYHHALSGTVDPSWTAADVAAFRVFANRIARIFAPGQGVAATLAREFGLTRPVDALFAMAPDETRGAPRETTHERPETSDQRPQTRDRGQDETLDHRPETIDQGNEMERSSSSQQRTDVYGLKSEVHGLRSNVCGLQSAVCGLRFGILCRFTDQKGIAHILEALRMFRDTHGEADFTFAGQGPLEPAIREFARQHGLSRVRVCPVPSVPEVMQALDVFVHPGLDDAMPVSIVEALMFGVPCIATRVGGVPDLLRDGIEGILIAPGAAAPIHQAMARFAGLAAAEFQAYRERARARYVEVCRPAVVGAQVARHYAAILSATGVGRAA